MIAHIVQCIFIRKIVFSKAVGYAFRCKDMGFSNSLQTHQTKIKVLQMHKLLIIRFDNLFIQKKNLKTFNLLFCSFLHNYLEEIYYFPIFAADKTEKYNPSIPYEP